MLLPGPEAQQLAYAVLSYIDQAAVHQYGWTPGHRLDGLGRAETDLA